MITPFIPQLVEQACPCLAFPPFAPEYGFPVTRWPSGEFSTPSSYQQGAPERRKDDADAVMFSPGPLLLHSPLNIEPPVGVMASPTRTTRRSEAATVRLIQATRCIGSDVSGSMRSDGRTSCPQADEAAVVLQVGTTRMLKSSPSGCALLWKGSVLEQHESRLSPTGSHIRRNRHIYQYCVGNESARVATFPSAIHDLISTVPSLPLRCRRSKQGPESCFHRTEFVS